VGIEVVIFVLVSQENFVDYPIKRIHGHEQSDDGIMMFRVEWSNFLDMGTSSLTSELRNFPRLLW
jgi:hypothetical protein